MIDRAVPSVGRRELEYMRDWCEAYGEKPGVDSRYEVRLGISNKDLYIVCVNAFTVLCVHESQAHSASYAVGTVHVWRAV